MARPPSSCTVVAVVGAGATPASGARLAQAGAGLAPTVTPRPVYLGLGLGLGEVHPCCLWVGRGLVTWPCASALEPSRGGAHPVRDFWLELIVCDVCVVSCVVPRRFEL